MFLATHGVLRSNSGDNLYLPWSSDAYSFDYDGSLDYIDVGNDSLLSFERTDVFSFSCWFKCGSLTSAQTILSKVTNARQGYYLLVASNGKLVFSLGASNTDRIFTYPTNGFVNDNNWHHSLVVYDGSSSVNGIEMYVDGQLESITKSSTTSVTGSTVNSEPFLIGTRYSTSMMNGLIDEPAVFNSQLGSVAASNLYGGGSANDIASQSFSGPIGWWRAENATFDGSNWTVKNSYTQGLDGTSVSMTSNSRVTDIPT